MSAPASRLQTFAISITPFTADGTLDEAAFRAHLRRLNAAGVGIYVGGGGSGEGYALSREETERILEIAAQELKGKGRIRAMGKEPRTAAEMIDFIRMVEKAGLDASQVYSLDVGHGHAPTPKELDAYFDEVLSSTTIPLVLSTHQSVGYVIPAAVIIEIYARHKHLIGLNVSHQDPNYLRQLIDALADRVDILVGGPHQATMALALGAHGFLSSEANLAPKTCQSVIEAARAGDADLLLQRWGIVLRLFMALYGNGGIRATKAVLNTLGLSGGYPRKPRLPADNDSLAKAMAVVNACGVAAIEGW